MADATPPMAGGLGAAGAMRQRPEMAYLTSITIMGALGITAAGLGMFLRQQAQKRRLAESRRARLERQAEVWKSRDRR